MKRRGKEIEWEDSLECLACHHAGAGIYLFHRPARHSAERPSFGDSGLQFVLGVFVLRVPAGRVVVPEGGDGAKHLLDFSYVGSSFRFWRAGQTESSLGLIFAFQVLPTIIFIAAFFAVLYHFGVMQLIIRAGPG